MKRIENLINKAMLSIVLSLFLLGSMTEFYVPTVIVLSSMLTLSVAALIFFLRARNRLREMAGAAKATRAVSIHEKRSEKKIA